MPQSHGAKKCGVAWVVAELANDAGLPGISVGQSDRGGKGRRGTNHGTF